LPRNFQGAGRSQEAIYIPEREASWEIKMMALVWGSRAMMESTGRVLPEALLLFLESWGRQPGMCKSETTGICLPSPPLSSQGIYSSKISIWNNKNKLCMVT
jgi:hypothetical protein